MNFKAFCDMVEEMKKQVPDPEHARIEIKKHLFGDVDIKVYATKVIEKAED